MSKEITDALDGWEYDPDNTIRYIDTPDGRHLLQVRSPMGIEQYQLEGRPDGAKPFGRESVLDELEARIAQFVEEHGEDSGYNINHDDFVTLQNESAIFYFRYLLLFQIGDYQRSARDTEHNLQLCGLVERYCTNKEDRKSLLQYKPYILRVNALSRMMVHLSKNEKTDALEILDTALKMIEAMPNIGTKIFDIERKRSSEQLRKTHKQLQEYKIGVLDKLESELQEAVEGEDYERAVELRDKITQLRERETEQ